MADKENPQQAEQSGNDKSEPKQENKFVNIEEQLMEKFPLKDVEWVIVNAYDYTTRNGRQIKAFAKPYIKKESAERRADLVLGSFNWKNDYSMPDSAGRFKFKIEIRKLAHHFPEQYDDAKFINELEKQWIPKVEGGSVDQNARGGLSDNAFEAALSFAEKRAWAKVGIGRYLKLVPQVEVQVSEGYKDGWNKYGFKSKIDGDDSYVKFYWREPRLPEWALREDEEYENQPPNNTDDPDPPSPDEQEEATEKHWKIILAYYNNIGQHQEQWESYLFEHEVDDDTAEILNTKRRNISIAFAKKIIKNMRNRYGKLNDDGVPKKVAAAKRKAEKKKKDSQAADNNKEEPVPDDAEKK